MNRSIVLHQYQQTIGDFKNIFAYIKAQTSEKDALGKLHIYPELFLTGYPLQDLCLQKSFFKSYINFLSSLHEHFKALPLSESRHILGGLEYKLSESGFPASIKNSIFLGVPGVGIESIYSKRLLPSYDIFDESKYFTPGNHSKVLEWKDYKIGLLICEDMWISSHYKTNPIEELKAIDTQLDLIINISASPFALRKHQSRVEQAIDISHTLKAPFIYVNTVGGEDEVLFDGASFIVAGDKTLEQLQSFEGVKKEIDIDNIQKDVVYKADQLTLSHSWEDLFKPDLKDSKIRKLSDHDCESLIAAIGFGFREYAKKNSFSKFSVALSGGIDSTLVLALIKLSLESSWEVEAIYMPSQFSARKSLTLSEELCESLGVTFKVFPIKFLHSVTRNAFKDNFKEKFEGVADENIQARLRGAIIYARSNQTGSMVINTSNKSEISVGYSTLYGDSVGAISMIGDLFKTEVYDLCRFINKKYSQLIPEGIIARAPSAELREDQKDQDSLPPYEILDTILESFLSYRCDRDDLLAMGINQGHVDQVLRLHCRSEFKRKQFCPILKLKTKSFGFGHRVPINKVKDFYFD